MNRRRTRGERSRRCLLLAGVVFLAVQLGVGLILDRSLPKIRFSHGEQVMNTAATLRRPPDILFLGSSRFRSGLIMGEIQEFMSSSFGEQAPLMFNAAVPACDPFVMDYLVRLLSSQGITPGTVIMEISRETIQLGCPWMDSHLTRVMTWQDMPDALEDFIASRRISRLLSSRIIPIFLYRKELLTWIFDSSPPYLKAASADEAAPVKPAPGAQNNPKPQQADAVKISHSVPPHIAKSYRNYQIRGINPRHLESMLTFLHERNVAVILVGVPVCRDHLDCYSTEINQKFMDYIEYLTRAYGCSFVEYCDRIPNEFFVDDLHLNLTGAVSFTRMLASEVLHDAWINSGRCEEHGSPSIKRVGE